MLNSGGLQDAVDKSEEAVATLNALIIHPDDLHTKLSILRKKISNEKSFLEGQLLTGVRGQLDDVKRGLERIVKMKNEVKDISENLKAMDKTCQEQFIERFEFVKSVCIANQHINLTKQMYDRFDELESEINRVVILLTQEIKLDYASSDNLLLIHYHLIKLQEFREKMLFQTNESSAEIQRVLSKFFVKLDMLWDSFEDYFWKLCANIVEFSKGREGSLVVRILKIIEYEEREDLNHIEMENRQTTDSKFTKNVPKSGRFIRSFRSKLMNSLHDSLSRSFRAKINDETLKYVGTSLQEAEYIIDELIFIQNEVVPKFPKSYNIFDFFVLEYHRNIYEVINHLLSKEIGPGDILEIVSWVNSYYEKMNDKLSVPKELLEPKLLDEKEDILIHEYIKLTKRKVGEWITNLLAYESKAFQLRENPPEIDAKGLYISPGITVDLFHIIRQHIESTSRSSRSKLLSDVVIECVECLLSFQGSLLKMIEYETNKAQDKPDEVPSGLEEYLIMISNSCMISCDNLEEISRKVETEIDEQYKPIALDSLKKCIDGFTKLCKQSYGFLLDIMFKLVKVVFTQLFTQKWYEEGLVETILVTFQDYFNDYHEHLHEYIFNKLINDTMERFIIKYIESMRARSIKYKQGDASEHLYDDYANTIQFFSQYKPLKRVQKTFEPLEKLLPVFGSSKKMVFVDFFALYKMYPDFPLGLLDDIISRRDDFDKSTVREIMDTIKKKIKEEKPEKPADHSSIYSKIKD